MSFADPTFAKESRVGPTFGKESRVGPTFAKESRVGPTFGKGARVHLALTYTQDQVAGARGVGDAVEAESEGSKWHDLAEDKREGGAHP